MSEGLVRKWDSQARFYEKNAFGAERRWCTVKREMFSKMGDGEILFLASGPGIDFKLFPLGKDIQSIDISPEMVTKARGKAAGYQGSLEIQEMDARHLKFKSDSFDQVFTACTFCSVPDPVDALKELHRVLKPDGEIWMFEHTGSNIFPVNFLLKIMNPLSEKFGPSITRNTSGNLEEAGFNIESIENVYLDVVKIIHAKPA